jgi:hypothetical protein
MNFIGAPCFMCADRKLGCHAECTLYSEYKQAVESDKQLRMARQEVLPIKKKCREY